MSGPEAALKRQVKRVLEAFQPRLWFWMPVPMRYAKRGVPDFVGVMGGLFFSIETKAASTKKTGIQTYIGSLILRAGGRHWVVRATGSPGEDELTFDEWEEAFRSWAQL